ncbi:MAG: polysaccharide biosynthesis C-terminal domain-containing protein, partial [Paracoccaceae bacterium]
LFFARENTRSPFYYALIAMVVNAGIAIGLAPVIGYLSAAIATTLAGWAMVFQLWRGSRAMGEAARFDSRFLTRLPRIVAAAAIMGAVLWAAAWALEGALQAPGLRYLALTGLIVLGIVTYFGAGGLIGAFRMADFKSALKRG